MTDSTYITEGHGAEVAHSMCVLYAERRQLTDRLADLGMQLDALEPKRTASSLARHDGAKEHKPCGACRARSQEQLDIDSRSWTFRYHAGASFHLKTSEGSDGVTVRHPCRNVTRAAVARAAAARYPLP
jgi:hypothetical protein